MTDFSRLAQELRRVGRDKIIRRYARLKADGSPVRCTSGAAARASDDPLLVHSEWKVIYDSEEAARACEEEMRELLGSRRQWVYPCRRSRHGHVHLTSKRPR